LDAQANRQALFKAGLLPHLKEHPRHRQRPKRGRKRLGHAAMQAWRDRVERTLAGVDPCQRWRLRCEPIQQRHYGMKLMAYTLINLRHFGRA
jgi:hypothetical protein